jgi:heptosyltransferase II
LNQKPKILVVGPSWVGDMVMAQSLFMTLKMVQPESRIDVLAPAWTFSLLDRMPEVALSIAMPLTHGQFGFMDRIKLGRQLKSEHYDQAIVLPNSWKSALIPFFAAIPLRTGFLGEFRWGLLNDPRKLDTSKLTMTVQRFVELAVSTTSPTPRDYPIPKLVVEQNRRQIVVEKFKLTCSTKILALCPGAEFGSAKRWPASYFAEVARQKIKQGWQVWLFGSEKDKDIASQINHETGDFCTDFSGRTSLAEAVDLMSLVDCVITNDSGLMHVAAALDKKIIALYGSSDPGFTPPLNANAQIVSLNLACSPCFKRQCPLYPPGHTEHTQCLSGILPSRVLDLLDS